MTNRSLLILMVVIVLGLLGGAAITDGGVPFSGTEQVYNPEASTLEGTNDQFALLALSFVVIIGSMGGIATAFYLFFYLTNRQLNTVEEEADNPVDFSLQTEGNSIGALIQNNAFSIVFLIVTLLVIVLVSSIVISGSLGIEI